MSSSSWEPTMFLRQEDALDTSMGTARIVTDAGPAYIKALGNAQGPHPLACEWVATQLARWFGLPTFQVALMRIDAAVDEIRFLKGGCAASGTAFLARATNGHVWGGSPEELAALVNPGAVSRLVVFDTWTRNCDRFPPELTRRRPNYDNVFLEDVREPPGGLRLVAMDHTHCFTCGRNLDASLAHIDRVKDDKLYGMFPAFIAHVRHDEILAAIAQLRSLDAGIVGTMIDSIPVDWDVKSGAREALREFVVRRADFVADNICSWVATQCWPNQLFDGGKGAT